MKKFHCIVSRRGEKKSTKKIKKQSLYESRSFTIEAIDFAKAVILAEKTAKGLMVFERISVREA